MSVPIDIIGAGAFGTALAIALADTTRPVTLWGRNPDKIAAMRKHRQNATALKGATFPQSLALEHALENLTANIALIALPTQTLRPFLQQNAQKITAKTLVALSKGIDLQTGLLPHQIIASLSNATPALLSGPAFANDISKNLPTAVVLATEDPKCATKLQKNLACKTLRIYCSHDPNGVALGGALKNVIAIAAGITIGAGLGQSARAAIISRGFTEMKRIAQKLDAKPETLAGLSGLGDLVLSCTDEQSRNYAFGLAIGGGKPPKNQTTEGIATAKAIAQKAHDLNIETPLITMVAHILKGNIALSDAITELRKRPLRME